MILQAADIVACYLTHKSLTPLLDYVSVNRQPTYSYKPPISWRVNVTPQVVSALYDAGNTVGRGLPNRVHLGLLAVLLSLDKPHSNHVVMREYLQDNGIDYPTIKRCINHVRKLGFPRKARSRRHIGMEYKRQALAKLK